MSCLITSPQYFFNKIHYNQLLSTNHHPNSVRIICAFPLHIFKHLNLILSSIEVIQTLSPISIFLIFSRSIFTHLSQHSHLCYLNLLYGCASSWPSTLYSIQHFYVFVTHFYHTIHWTWAFILSALLPYNVQYHHHQSSNTFTVVEFYFVHIFIIFMDIVRSIITKHYLTTK